MKYFLILLPFLMTFSYWASEGSRLSFWANQVENREEIPIIEGMPELGTQTKVTWQKKFVPGIETPTLGFFISTILFLSHYFSKRSLKKSSL
jgi:hypothetical protein